MAEVKYYKTGAKAGFFYDPSQPSEDNKKLIIGQVKPLSATQKVNASLRAGGIVMAEKSEYTKYQKALVEQKKASGNTKGKGDNSQLVSDLKAKESEIADLKAKLGEQK